MIQVAILTRRLKEGKTYEDFRKAWYHTVGFGTANKMYTMINAFDPREIVVIGFTEASLDQMMAGFRIDIKERSTHPLDEVIEPEIGRKFGLLVAEDDFSAAGALEYRPPAVHGVETDMAEFAQDLQQGAELVARAARERDSARSQAG